MCSQWISIYLTEITLFVFNEFFVADLALCVINDALHISTPLRCENPQTYVGINCAISSVIMKVL